MAIYPVPRAEDAAMYRLYEAEAKRPNDVSFVGRLATCKY
jgi:UDP-galactopyranose mutase